jgi:hypothetical protein
MSISYLDELLDQLKSDTRYTVDWLARIELRDLRAELAALEAQVAQQAERIAALENDIVCAFCGTHYRADDVPPEHWRTCEKSPLVQAINEAREIIGWDHGIDCPLDCAGGNWLAAHPAPEVTP